MTQPGNLQCKKIIHMTGQTKAALIHKYVKAVLQMCVANSYTSVSFPAIGTGELHQQNVLYRTLGPMLMVVWVLSFRSGQC